MSITFGSVGDVIAVGQIIFALAQALTHSRGSAREYQDLVKELQAFDQALLQVVALWQNYENSPELEALGKTTKEAIKGWRDTLLAFRLKVDKKYGTSLRPGGSGNWHWLKDASKKAKWLTEKEDILELRRKLHSASDTITMSILAAMGKSNRLTSSAQSLRVELVHGLLQETIKQAEEQMAQLKLMDEKLDSQATTSNMILATVKSGVNYITQVHAIAIDMKSVLALLHNNIVSLQATPRGLGTHWQQEPVTLEDALGFLVPIPLELVNSWDMFETILTKRFEKHTGHIKMLRREFAIEEGNSGREVSRTKELTSCLRPGQKIDMSMIFQETSGKSNHCPRCKMESAASSEERTQCTSCRGWFQRVTEVEEPVVDFEVVSSDGQQRATRVAEKVLGKGGLVSSPADFQRVRMLRKIAFYIEEPEDLEANDDESDFGLSEAGEAGIRALFKNSLLHHSYEDTYPILPGEATNETGTGSTFLSRKDRDETPQDRWARIRKNAAERAAQRHKEKQSKREDSQETSDDEETIEARVARIKARVAELTGNMDTSSSPELLRSPSRSAASSPGKSRQPTVSTSTGSTPSNGEYSDGSDVVLRKRIVKKAGSRGQSPRHKRHLAEGVLAGIGAAALLAKHRDEQQHPPSEDIDTSELPDAPLLRLLRKDDHPHHIKPPTRLPQKKVKGSEPRGRQVAGGEALGALGTEVLTRARSRYLESHEDSDPHEDKSRSQSRYPRRRYRQSYEDRSRSQSRYRDTLEDRSRSR